jgi:arginine exporter protein ArgO
MRGAADFCLVFFIVLMSPWNIAFWLAVIGGQPAPSASVRQSFGIAVAVVLSALTWGVVLCTAVRFGAHVFSNPNWQVATEAITAAVMLWFAIGLLFHFP